MASYPASDGCGEDTGNPNLITRSGIHVVNGLDETKLMSNPRYGYTDIPEKWAVRISNNGEFIHANPASSDAQGTSNVTHGCVRSRWPTPRTTSTPRSGVTPWKSPAPRSPSDPTTATSTSGR